MQVEDRRFYSRLALASGVLLLLFGWLFWQAGTGPALAAAAAVGLVAALSLDHSRRGIGLVVLAVAIGLAPVWLTHLYAG